VDDLALSCRLDRRIERSGNFCGILALPFYHLILDTSGRMFTSRRRCLDGEQPKAGMTNAARLHGARQARPPLPATFSADADCRPSTRQTLEYRMSKRIRSVCIAVAAIAASSSIAGMAEARSYKGASASRSCLTAPARSLLSRIEQKFGPVQVISTCRPGARIAGTGKISRHASGNAVDFSAGGRKGAIINWLIANHRSGGTMTYSHMNHIHVDIGPHFVSLAGRTRVASSRGKWSNRMALGARSSGRSRAAWRNDDDREEARPRSRTQRHAAEPRRSYGIDEPAG
jgi:hypothetical protein